ncbi:MAG: GH92 family glycosyl hydrolase [Myxococcota bacterium]
MNATTRTTLALLFALLLALAACDDDGGDSSAADTVGPDATGDVPADAADDATTDAEEDTGPPPPLVIDDLRDLASLVDPMIGSDGSGNVIPGALVPHGMIRVSPDTDSGAGSIAAYEYDDPHIQGFTHTHLEGPGGSSNGYSQILLMPTTGSLATESKEYQSAFSHDTEAAEAGYYAVTLDDHAVDVEVTAAAHSGVHRYVFPESDEARVLLDLDHSNGLARGGSIEAVDDRTLQGFGDYNLHPALDFVLQDGTTGETTVYFYARFDRPFEEVDFWGDSGDRVDGAWVRFATDAGDAVEVRIGISFISVEQARTNMEAEVAERSFEEVRQAAWDTWNERLNRIRVEGDEDHRRAFYTALYHHMFQPADHTEVGGRFHSAADGVGDVFDAEGRRFYTDDWCMWDTFRTTHPLATLVEPETRGDVVWSMLHLYDQGGWLPKCTWHAAGYSRVMIGNHAIPIIVDPWVKGVRDFDPDLAWEAMLKASTEDNDNPASEGACGYFNLGTVPAYLDLGWVPRECDSHQSASMTLEHAYNDWVMAQMADALGLEDERERFLERAGNFRNHWNPEHGFMQGRRADGTWVEPFDPTDDRDANDFCEATSWIYSFFVPHDVPALVELMGGEEAFVERLDTFFADDHYEQSNQPSWHIPWLYNFAGRPDKTQARVREVLDTEYGTAPNGLPGNDDAGSMSAWYVLSALGLYPVAPGGTTYQLGSPLFDRATLHLHPGWYDGGTFVIETVNNGPDHVYVQSATLNGEPLEAMEIDHADLAAGGTLVLEMGPAPPE